MKRILNFSFAVITGIIYGGIATGQILSVTRLYYSWLVLPLSILTSILIIVFYFHFGKDFLASSSEPASSRHNPWLTTAFLISGMGIFVLFILIPLAHWPFSPITADLPWDAGLYHFPKAMEMIVTHSSLDLSISYGEYPFGYESLIALAFLLNRGGYLLGMVHALISLFLLLSIWLLILKRTRIPAAAVVLILSVMFISKQLFPAFDSNAWWIFWPQITLIGKNDAFLAAAMLAVLYFVPTSKKEPFFPFGLAVASMVAVCIKPMATLVVAFAWLMMLFFIWRAKKLQYLWKQLIWSAVVMAPGALWMIRNLLLQGTFFSAESLRISAWSIASNLFNPYLYRYILNQIYLVLVVIGISLLVSIFKRSLRFDVLAAVIFLLSFAMTPASAFLGSNQEPALLAWRFALALLAYVLILLLALLEPIIMPVYNWICNRKMAAIAAAVLVVGLGIWVGWTQRDLLETFPQNEIVLHDQYHSSVGVDGYYSAYDYVQKNIHHSIVIIENGLPFYLYDHGLTNSVTRSLPADDIVYLQTAWLGEGGYPEKLNQSDWLKTWSLIYEDSEGRVYKRK